ncbi:MAG: DUF4020 domain-containing protein [Gemmatimonadaceae bacterium]|nr:DUF4020 domain-containing protein [Gemmatimonadaceae bacterium]
MQLTSLLNLPDELELARVKGELIVFAGAGVSMGAPALLPSFVELARRIGEPKVPLTKGDESSLDRYLGRVDRQNVDVQQRARDHLPIRSGHNPLHEYLLGIFSEPSQVRLITTNFDPHFGNAANKVFPNAAIPQYIGPALPPGKDFKGIVQLHGALDPTWSRLVLTDRDFADAYMAEAWAARFLARALADRTVLFVGYSLSDTILRYLLQAIPQSRWYALWPKAEVGQGSEHDILPVVYGADGDEAPYEDLNAGMKRWHWHARASVVDHDHQIREIIKTGPPISPIDQDYLKDRLNTPHGQRIFWELAKTDAWFSWTVDAGFLNALFDPENQSENRFDWARWALQHFTGGENPPLLRLLRSRPFSLNNAFRTQLLFFLIGDKPLPPPTTLRQLIAVLVADGNASPDHHEFVHLLMKRLANDGYHREAIAVLRSATALSLVSRERFEPVQSFLHPDEGDLGLPPLAIRVATHTSASEIAAFLNEDMTELLTTSASLLLALGEQRVEEAYGLLDLAKGTREDGDTLSDWYTSIAPSEQNRFAHAENVLVGLVRTPLDHFGKNDPARLVRFSDQYVSSDRGLMRRLALYAIAQNDMLDADAVLKQVVDLKWPQDYRLRPELYLLLRNHFPKASDSAKAAFITALRSNALWGEHVDSSDQRIRFSYSVLLLRLSPDDVAVQSFAEEERKAHPDWEESDPEGLLIRMTVQWGSSEPSPITAEDLGRMSAAEAYSALHSLLSNISTRDYEFSLKDTIQQVARKNPAWTGDLLELTLDGDEHSQTIAKAALWGVRETTEDSYFQLTLLDRVNSGRWNMELTSVISSVIEHWSGNLAQVGANDERLDRLDAAADLIFERSRLLDSNLSDGGWTERAINHPAGNAAQIWWNVANMRDRVEGQQVLSVDDTEKTRWMRVLEDATAAGAFSRPILGMATDRLAAGDFSWAAATVFPAFDMAKDPQKAAQLWDGRLMQGRIFRGTFEGLRPYLNGLFERSVTLLPKRSEQIGDFVALIVALRKDSGFTLALLHEFIERSSADARRTFAHSLASKLEMLGSDERHELWTTLLKQYLADRRTNMPVPLASEEIAGMVHWVEELPEAGMEVVEALRLLPRDQIPQLGGFAFDLASHRQDFVATHPDVAASLIVLLAERQSIDMWAASFAFDVLEAAHAAGATLSRVQEALSHLTSLDPKRAAELAAKLPMRDGSD